jgi:hypothetical protein
MRPSATFNGILAKNRVTNCFSTKKRQPPLVVFFLLTYIYLLFIPSLFISKFATLKKKHVTEKKYLFDHLLHTYVHFHLPKK